MFLYVIIIEGDYYPVHINVKASQISHSDSEFSSLLEIVPMIPNDSQSSYVILGLSEGHRRVIRDCYRCVQVGVKGL
jgi:hypothetical protein